MHAWRCVACSLLVGAVPSYWLWCTVACLGCFGRARICGAVRRTPLGFVAWTGGGCHAVVYHMVPWCCGVITSLLCWSNMLAGSSKYPYLVSQFVDTSIPLSLAAKISVAHLASNTSPPGQLLCNQWLFGLSLGASLSLVTIGYVLSHAATLRYSVCVIAIPLAGAVAPCKCHNWAIPWPNWVILGSLESSDCVLQPDNFFRAAPRRLCGRICASAGRPEWLEHLCRHGNWLLWTP